MSASNAKPDSTPGHAPQPRRPRPETIIGAASVDQESFDALLSVMRTPMDDGNAGRRPPAVGPRQTAALGLLSRAHGEWASLPKSGSDILARQPGYFPAGVRLVADTTETAREVPPLLLLIPEDHRENRRDDGHSDFEQLRAKGLIRDRDGEVIEIRSIWHAWGAHRMDRFFQAYCRAVLESHARGEAFPSENVRAWVHRHADQIGMPIEVALRIIRDGCGGCPGANAMWWRGASLQPPTSP